MNKNDGIKINLTKSDNSISLETVSNGRDSPKSKLSTKSAEHEIPLDNKNVFYSCDSINEQSKYSFSNFIKEFQDANSNKKAPWNNEKDRYIKESITKKRILLREINQFDYNVNISIRLNFSLLNYILISIIILIKYKILLLKIISYPIPLLSSVNIIF